MKITALKILIGVLVTASVAMAAYVYRAYRVSSSPVPSTGQTPAITATPTAPTQDPGRAFAKLSNAGASAQKGGTWSVNIETNTWATCMVDLYRPDETILELGKDAAKASFVSPGKFIWTWSVPSNAASGSWVARVICGTYENLATADQAVQVR